MAEVPNPFEWNAEWDQKNKENFELVKKLDDNREDADARKVSHGSDILTLRQNFVFGNRKWIFVRI